MHLDCNKYTRVPANLPKLFDTRITEKVSGGLPCTFWTLDPRQTVEGLASQSAAGALRQFDGVLGARFLLMYFERKSD
jgi:hypothetical protein